MEHCTSCHLNFNWGDRHSFNCDRKQRKCSTCLSPEKQELLKKIHQKEIREIEGIFNDFKPNVAYIERTEGYKIWFHGCTIPYKLDLNPLNNDATTGLKRVILSYLKLAFKYPFLFLIRRKTLVEYFYDNYASVLGHKTVQFNPFCQELLLKGREIALEIPLKGIEPVYEYQYKVIELIRGFVSFFQCSLSYYIILQDMFSEIDQTKDPIKEVKRVIDLGLSRISKEIGGAAISIKPFRKILPVFLFLYGKPLKRFILSLDMSKIRKDDSDIYYSYRRKFYDTDGKSYEKRMAIIRMIDEENNHLIYD